MEGTDGRALEAQGRLEVARDLAAARGRLEAASDTENAVAKRLRRALKHEGCFLRRVRKEMAAIDAGGDWWVINASFNGLMDADYDLRALASRWIG